MSITQRFMEMNFKSLKEGQRVRFEIEDSPKSSRAKNVQII